LLFEAADPETAFEAASEGRHLPDDRNLFAFYRFEFITKALEQLDVLPPEPTRCRSAGLAGG